MSKDVKDFSNLLFSSDQSQFSQIAEGMEIDPTALLRRLHEITIDSQDITIDERKVVITVHGTMGIRHETGTGAEDLTGLNGREYGNAIKSAETVAKRRLTTNLLGYGYRHSIEETANAAFAAVEPVVPVVPGPVNNAAAAVVPDTRGVTSFESAKEALKTVTVVPSVPIMVASPEAVSVPEFKLPAVPKITETALTSMHKEANDAFNKQVVPQNEAHFEEVANVPAPKKPAAPMSAQAGFFDMPTPPGEPAIPPVPAPPSTIEASQPVTASVPVTTVEPVPVSDIKVEPVASTAPNQQQYRAIQVRCTKLVRDVLPKAGKGADALLVPYMRKRLGVTDLQKGSLLVWEETLGQLEAFPTAKDLAQFLNGGKPFTGR